MWKHSCEYVVLHKMYWMSYKSRISRRKESLGSHRQLPGKRGQHRSARTPPLAHLMDYSYRQTGESTAEWGCRWASTETHPPMSTSVFILLCTSFLHNISAQLYLLFLCKLHLTYWPVFDLLQQRDFICISDVLNEWQLKNLKDVCVGGHQSVVRCQNKHNFSSSCVMFESAELHPPSDITTSPPPPWFLQSLLSPRPPAAPVHLFSFS